MQITNNKVVAVHYELKNEKDGKIVESTYDNQPLTFLFGHKNMLPKFEENLKKYKKGEKFQFMLSAEDAYGKYNPQMLIDVSKDIFTNQETLLKISKKHIN